MKVSENQRELLRYCNMNLIKRGPGHYALISRSPLKILSEKRGGVTRITGWIKRVAKVNNRPLPDE